MTLALLGGAVPAGAGVLTPTASLPLIGVPYTTTGSAGCFPVAGVCIGGGAVTFTAVISSSFDSSGQHIQVSAAYGGSLTTLLGAPLGVVTLGGIVAMDVLGRASDDETGSWASVLTAVSLSGAVLGRTLSLELASSPPSAGETTITPLDGTPNEGEPAYRIDSFFDIFVDLTLDTVPPLSATRGPLRITATEVPAPAGAAVLAVGLLGLLLAPSRRVAERRHGGLARSRISGRAGSRGDR